MANNERDYDNYIKAINNTRFEFLRLLPVDLMHYLPPFLKKDDNFSETMRTLSNEHEEQRLLLQDIAAQFFVDTATWGLSSWERIYQTKPPPDADYALRRSLIKAKMLGAGTMTVDSIKQLVNQFIVKRDAEIDELPSPGTFLVIMRSGTYRLPEIRQALAEMAPAHLLFGFQIDLNPNKDGIDYYTGIAHFNLGLKTILIREPPDSIINYNAGVGHVRIGSVTIGAGEAPSPSPVTLHEGIMTFRTGRVKVSYDITDLDESAKDRLYPAGVKIRACVAEFRLGGKHIDISVPDDTREKHYAGMYEARMGRKRLGLNAPTKARQIYNAGIITGRTGHVIIDAAEE
ncbi:MAG: DUF2313 domain-containing protein [Schwartzia sp.]|nr:DUF2313 domain-containing protein [Schwartzia sp. (in: firmicutes)]